jgi:hypothetical protein
MKLRKFNFNWQSMVLGMMLCAVLAVFIASKPAGAQVTTSQTAAERGSVLQRTANITDIYNKSVILEAKLVAIEDHCKVIEKKIDDTYNLIYYKGK